MTFDTFEQIGEQVLHFVWSAIPLVAYSLIPVPVLNGAIAGLLWALPRELVDQWPIERPWDTVLDLSFFTLGGALAGLLGWLLE